MSVPKGHKRPVLVLGSSPTALAVVRELACQRDFFVAVADTQRGCAGVSRYAAQFFLLANDGGCSLTEALASLARLWGCAPFVVPTSDAAIEWLETLDTACFQTFRSYRSGLALDFLDKQKIARLVAEHSDFAQPRTVNLSVVDPDAPPLPLPFFCKPRSIHRHRHDLPGQKGFIIRSAHEWRAWCDRFGGEAARWLLQEIIPGAEDNIVLFAGAFGRDGRVLGGFSARKLRQYPPGFGSATQVVTEDIPELAARAMAFLRRLGYTGVCCGEFKWCPQRRDWVVIEFNPRPSLWYAAVSAGGLPLTRLAMTDVLSDLECKDQTHDMAVTPGAGLSSGHVPPVHWRYVAKDLASAWFYRRHGKRFVLPPPNPKRYVSGTVRPVFAVFRWSDPVPLLVEWMTYFRKGLARLRRRAGQNRKEGRS